MQRNQKVFAVTVFFLVGCLVRLAFGGHDGVPNQFPGGIYKATPATMVDGDNDILHLDANGNLKVTTAGAVGASAGQVQGTTADAAAQVGNSIPIAGKDNAGNIRTANVTPHLAAAGATPNGVLVHGFDTANGVVRGVPVIPGGATYAQSAAAIPVMGSDGVNGRMLLTDASGRQIIVGAAANGAAPAGNPAYVGGLEAPANVMRPLPVCVGADSYGPGTNFMPIGGTDSVAGRMFLTDTAGRTTIGDTSKATYSAAAIFAPAATPGDSIRITGSASKIVKVRRITLSGTQTTAGAVQLTLIKRSASDTAGTFVAATSVPHDATDAAGTISVGHYTANPTQGTNIGNVRADWFYIPATSTAGVGQNTFVYDFTLDGREKVVTLNSATQELDVNFAGQTIAGFSLAYSIEWTEE